MQSTAMFGSEAKMQRDDLVAVDCNARPGAAAMHLARASLAENTQRAYKSDISQMLAEGVTFPCGEADLADYLSSCAGRLATATLRRRIASVSKLHRTMGWPNPTQSEIVRAVTRGIIRTTGRPQTQAKALLVEDLRVVANRMRQSAADMRDRAILLVGFAGALRRSELVALDFEDIAFQREGMTIRVRHSKADRSGNGRSIAVPYGRTSLCPVTALLAWLNCASIETGPMFRAVDRWGAIGAARLSDASVTLILRQRLQDAGFDPAGYSGHSLRAGLATSAAKAGVRASKIRAQTGHASDTMLARYIREADMFSDNAAGALL